MKQHVGSNTARHYLMTGEENRNFANTYLNYGSNHFYREFNVQRRTFDILVAMIEANMRDENGVPKQKYRKYLLAMPDHNTYSLLGLLWVLSHGGDFHSVPFLNRNRTNADIESIMDEIIAVLPFMVSLAITIITINTYLIVVFINYRSSLT